MKTVAIYGAGRMGRVLFDILNPIIDIKYFVDWDPLKCGKKIGKIEIISPEQFLIQGNCAVILSIENEAIEEFLLKNKITYFYAWKEKNNFMCIPEIKKRRDDYLLDRFLNYTYEKRALYIENVHEEIPDSSDQTSKENMQYYDNERLWYDEYVENRADLRLLCELIYLNHKDEIICDVGCGNGKLIEELQKHNVKVLGVDGAENRVLRLKEAGYEVYLKNFEESFEIEQAVDVVVCMHVLEHIVRVDQLIHSIYNMLKKQGTVYIGVPNGNMISDETHVRQFTGNSLCNLMIRHGFEIENIQRVPYLNYSFDNGLFLKATKV